MKSTRQTFVAGMLAAAVMLNGTPNEFTTFNGIAVPVKDQFLWYEFWGSDKTFPHFAAAWAWALDAPFKWCKQVASHFGGTAQGMVTEHSYAAGRNQRLQVGTLQPQGGCD